QQLVFVLEKLAGLIDFGVYIVLASLRPNANFLDLLLVDFGLGCLTRLLVAIFSKVHDLANWGSLCGGDFHQVLLRFPRQFHSLGCGYNAELFTVGPYQPHRADANLFVDAWAVAVAAALWMNGNSSFDSGWDEEASRGGQRDRSTPGRS